MPRRPRLCSSPTAAPSSPSRWRTNTATSPTNTPTCSTCSQIFQEGYKGALLYTVDPSKALVNGSLEGILAGVNFGTGSSEQGLAKLAALRPGAPLFSTEYWPGWFDLFGHPHETRPVAPQLKDIENVLSRGGSINIYVVTGGTNFGMMAGASASTGNYRGNVTSYDYDAPIDEAGPPHPQVLRLPRRHPEVHARPQTTRARGLRL